MQYRDYYELIQKPMCLDMVKRRIDGGSNKYERNKAGVAALRKDMKLIFDNAKQYNVAGSMVYEDATKLEEIFRNIVSAGIAKADAAALGPAKPKRPQSSFFLYCSSARVAMKASLSDGAAASEVAKELGARWKTLPTSERDHWDKEAGKEKKLYEGRMKVYNAAIANIGEGIRTTGKGQTLFNKVIVIMDPEVREGGVWWWRLRMSEWMD